MAKKTENRKKPVAERPKVKKILKVGGAVLLLCLAIVAVVYFIPKNNGSFSFEATKGYFTAKTFFNSLIKEDYEKAFKKLSVYDDENAVEKGSVLSSDDAYRLWSGRIKAEKGDTYATYIVDFEKLKVYKEDGVLKGTVTIEIRERGVSRYMAEELFFYDGKLYSITKYAPELMNQFEYAVSGYMGK